MEYTIKSASGTTKATVTYSTANGNPSYVAYRFTVNGVMVQSGVCRLVGMHNVVRKWAVRVLSGVTSVTKS